jgi:hypothetical protein
VRDFCSGGYTFASTTPGVYETHFYATPIHYLDPITNSFQDIDTRLVASADGWTMSKAPYTAAIKGSLGDDFLTFNNGDQSLSFSPSGAWGSSLASSTPIEPAENTELGLAQNKEVRWVTALGSGIDLDVLLDTDKVVKNVVVNSLASLGDLSGTSTYQIPFKLTSNHPFTIVIDGQTLSQGQPIISPSTVALVDTTTNTTTYIRAPFAIDSKDASDPSRYQRVYVRYELEGDGSLLITKLLPVDVSP